MSRESKLQQVGVLGGTFDPVHEGHLTVARTVQERYRLDHILFIPAFSPPHKDHSLASFSHRVAMLEAALASEGNMSISIIESERSGPSYTVETLKEIHQRLEASRFYLIMGADMFAEIKLWYQYSKLFELADIIVATRPGTSSGMFAELISSLPGDFNYDPGQLMWSRTDGFRVFLCQDLAVPVSSSAIREQCARGKSIGAFVPDAVGKYIEDNYLYTS